MTTTLDRIKLLRWKLREALVERDDEVDAVLTAMISGEHLLLVGPPGVAKSLLLRSACSAIEGARYFEYLLMKDTSRDELFGQLDMEALSNDHVWQRDTTKTLIEAELVFLDEFFRGSSYIANTILGAMQERQVRDCKVTHELPLRSLVAASNTWPGGDGQEEMGAVFDRFLIRCAVRPVSPAGRRKLVLGKLAPVTPCCTLEDIDIASLDAMDLEFTPEAEDALFAIIDELADSGIRPGDRRQRKSTRVAKAAAYLDGSGVVKPAHLECLGNVLWEDPIEHPAKCKEIVSRISNPIGAKLTELLSDVDEILSGVSADKSTQIAAIKKLGECHERAAALLETGNGRAEKAATYIKRELTILNAKALNIDVERALEMAGL
jgi:MoxR-like ATPase